MCADLLSEGRELEDVKGLVEARRILVDVHYHGDPARATEEELQEVSQLGLPEWNVVLDPAGKQILISSVILGFHSASFYSEVDVLDKQSVKSYLACWFSLMALMHFPSVSRELLMFPASFSLSPVL